MITDEDFVLYPQTAVWFVGNKIQWSPKVSLVAAAQQHHESQHNVMAAAVLWSPTPLLSSMLVIERQSKWGIMGTENQMQCLFSEKYLFL